MTHATRRDLLRLLAELGCVSLQKLEVLGSPVCSLFSTPPTVTLKVQTNGFPAEQLSALQEASVLDEDTELVVEAAVDAVTRLGMFIGDKVHPAQ